jgi:hypothetical protein
MMERSSPKTIEVLIFAENNSIALALSTNPKFQQRNQHINVLHRRARLQSCQAINAGAIQLEHMNTKLVVANDRLAKLIPQTQFSSLLIPD